MSDDWPEYLPDVRAACDIGCDEYGYPIRPTHVPAIPARALFGRAVKIGIR